MKEKKLETMEIKSKKKKTFIIVGAIVIFVVILFVSIASSVLKVKQSKIYKAKQMAAAQKKELKVIQQPEFKENWAIAIENKLEAQNKKIEDMNEKFQQNQLKIFQEIKDIVKEGSKRNEEKIEKLKTSLQKDINTFKEDVNKKIEEQNAKIESLSIMVDALKASKGSVGPKGEQEVVIGPNLLPEETNTQKQNKESAKNGAAEEKEKEKSPEEIANKILQEIAKKRKTEKKEEKQEEQGLTLVDIDTSFNQKIIQEQKKIEVEESEKKSKEENKISGHVTIGFTKAYLVTGVHAPVFSEGNSEPLPVLLEAEGKIVMANDVEGNIGRCFLIGSAKGEMNSQTAKIRLEKISCLMDGGKYRLEGNIKGWVIDGKSGMPGLHGELIHKNGAWMARTFVAGFLETFSEAITTNGVEAISFGNTGTTGTTNNEVSTKAAIGANAATAAGSGISAVFKKIGDYYLKMAEQIFPVIEVRGGRTVDILLLGGEDFTVVKNTPIDVNYLTEKIEQREAKRLKEHDKKDNIINDNPFTRVVLGNDKDQSKEAPSEEATNNASANEDKAMSDEQIVKVKIPE